MTIWTTFIMASDRLVSRLATGLSGPGPRFTPKPNRMEKTIRGSMALRLSRAEKSPTVKKFTIRSGMEMGSSTTPSARSLQGTRTGGMIFISTIMMAAAMAPVTMKVRMVVPMIVPARLRLRMVAMEPAMEANTMGTTMQNIMLMNRVPRGFRTVAPDLRTLPSASFT